MAEAERDWELTEERDGMLIQWNAPIPVADGTVLRADVFRPLAEGPHPAILSYGPYAKGLAFQDGYPEQWGRMVEEHPDVAAGSSNLYQSWEVLDPERWTRYGYVCVRVDSRGAGCSPGVIDPWSPREAQDYYDCIEWAAARDWCSGRVGLSGVSYFAINQWQVAGLQPPHLRAMVAWEGAADFYRDLSYHGGILCEFGGNWFRRQVMTVQNGLGEAGRRSRVHGGLVTGLATLDARMLAARRVDFGGDLLAHRFDDEYHRGRSAEWARVTVPFLSAANWGGQGLHLRGNVEAFVRAAAPRKWLEVHGLEHWTEYYTDYGLSLQKRFFDYFLKDEPNGWPEQPSVQLQVRHLDRFELRHEADWPIPRTRWTPLHLNLSRMNLDWEAPERTTASVSYAAASEGLTFTTAPLDRDIEITGPVASRLHISSSTDDADLFLVLRLFDPAGGEVVFQGALDPHTPIAQGWLRASHRALDPALSRPYRPYHTHNQPQPLEPGVVYPLDVELWPTSIVAPAGFRIGLTIRGRDYEHASGGSTLETFANVMRGCGPFIHADPRDRPADIFDNTVTIHAGNGLDAFVLLPVIPPVDA